VWEDPNSKLHGYVVCRLEVGSMHKRKKVYNAILMTEGQKGLYSKTVVWKYIFFSHQFPKVWEG